MRGGWSLRLGCLNCNSWNHKEPTVTVDGFCHTPIVLRLIHSDAGTPTLYARQLQTNRSSPAVATDTLPVMTRLIIVVHVVRSSVSRRTVRQTSARVQRWLPSTTPPVHLRV